MHDLESWRCFWNSFFNNFFIFKRLFWLFFVFMMLTFTNSKRYFIFSLSILSVVRLISLIFWINLNNIFVKSKVDYHLIDHVISFRHFLLIFSLVSLSKVDRLFEFKIFWITSSFCSSIKDILSVSFWFKRSGFIKSLLSVRF